MAKNKIPDRWLDYTPIGQRIQGTKLVAFKVPLKDFVCKSKLNSDSQWFTPTILLDGLPQLKAVIDLTNTNRYYDPEEFRSKGIDHFKILTVGRGELPPPFKIQEFYDAIDSSLKKLSESPDALIGVHCTHGLNRTGYFVCRWMVERMKMTPEDAISRFEAARGHQIERFQYINDIKSRNKIIHAPQPMTYNSPLEDPYYEEPRRTQRYGSRYQNNRSECNGNWRDRSDDNSRNYNNPPHRDFSSFNRSSRGGRGGGRRDQRDYRDFQRNRDTDRKTSRENGRENGRFREGSHEHRRNRARSPR